MTAIRPGLPAPLPAQRNTAPEGARAAQRAFFHTALTTAAPAQPAAIPVQTAPTPGSEPARTLRPGSLIDIRV